MRTLQNNEAVYCRTQEEFDSIIKELKEKGFKWCSGAIISINDGEYFDIYIQGCVRKCSENKIAFDSVEYLKLNGFIILNYDDVMNGESK